MRAGSIALLLLFLATGLAYSQKKNSADDACITDPSLVRYIETSPFQHGSLHGYEDGFQAGDTDFHLQRPMPDFDKVKEYRTATRGYEDGDKEEYRTGYRDGFLLGYQDAQAGRPFVAFERLQAAASHKPVAVAAAEPDASGPEDVEVAAAVAPPAKPFNIPVNALFPNRQVVSPPGPSPKDTALARIMNNLRRTFMPAVMPQAVVQGSPR